MTTFVASARENGAIIARANVKWPSGAVNTLGLTQEGISPMQLRTLALGATAAAIALAGCGSQSSKSTLPSGSWGQTIACLQTHPLFDVNGIHLDGSGTPIDDTSVKADTHGIQVWQDTKGVMLAYVAQSSWAYDHPLSGTGGVAEHLTSSLVYGFAPQANAQNRKDILGCLPTTAKPKPAAHAVTHTTSHGGIHCTGADGGFPCYDANGKPIVDGNTTPVSASTTSPTPHPDASWTGYDAQAWAAGRLACDPTTDTCVPTSTPHMVAPPKHMPTLQQMIAQGQAESAQSNPDPQLQAWQKSWQQQQAYKQQHSTTWWNQEQPVR